MKNKTAARIAALMGSLAVALGAFGAHGLKTVLENNHKTVSTVLGTLFKPLKRLEGQPHIQHPAEAGC